MDNFKISEKRIKKAQLIGYHYNWTSKKDSFDHHSPFPVKLGDLCQLIVTFVGFKGQFLMN